MINIKDIENILKKYNVGDLKKVGEIMKNDHASYGVIIFTEKRKYFLKIYRMFGKHTKSGLSLIEYLQRKKYPTNNLILSKNKRNYISYKNNKISLFGFIEEDEKLNLNINQVKEIGKYLGKLHILTKQNKLTKGRFSWNHFYGLICNHHNERKKAPKHIQEILEYIYDNIKNIKCKPNQPKAANHVEFTPEHVRFEKNKLVNIIDWDEINQDFCFYDFGTAMISCFTPKKLDYKRINVFLKAYNKERKLTDWEKYRVFEALQYGCFKFGIWNLTDPKTDKLNLNYKHPEDIERIKMLMKISKDCFQKKITV
jgi:homoserine kinase type II